MRHRALGIFVAGALLCAGIPRAAAAADIPLAIQNAARCAPRASAAALPPETLRIIGSQDPSPRTLYGSRDLLIIDAGTGRGITVNQRFTIRRVITFGKKAFLGPHAIGTAGWLRIVAANEATSIGLVEFACEGIERGDYLEPYLDPTLPDNVDRADTTGELDFTAPARILFGDKERVTGGVGDFMMIDAGSKAGFAPGARFAIYRDVTLPGLPLVPVGEAILVHSDIDTAVVRLTLTRDAIQRGDLMVPRKP
jgi:hypothetical protein